MKLLKSILIPLILGVSLIFGCSTLQTKMPSEVEVEKSHRSVINVATGIVYNIPTEFPNPFDDKEMEDFEGMQVEIAGGFVMAMFSGYSGTDDNKETSGSTYGLVFDPNSLALVAAVVVDNDDYIWKFWIYPGNVPVPCTKEEQESFLKRTGVSV